MMALDVQSIDISEAWLDKAEGAVPVVEVASPSAIGHRTKRALDLVLAVVALILLSPVFLIVAILIKTLDGGPLFYSHVRVGFGGHSFGCLKFRTMRTDAKAQLEALLHNNPSARAEWEETRKLKRDPRVTAIGEILRASSLDELPQLINIIRGDMSVVGPRPITVDEMGLYGEHIGTYLTGRPGLTGHWQTSGRSDVGYQQRVLLDVEYLRNWSLRHDLVIIAKTVPVLFSQRGSY